MQKYPMTPAGLTKLQNELKKLREVDRPANIKAIEEARAHGDLSENAEYKYAKEQQSLIAGRLEYLEDHISRAEVIDPTKLRGDRIVFGAKVLLENLDTGEQVTYRIVGEDESNINEGLISVTSPIARSMVGREPGDRIRVATPSGVKNYEIEEVEF
ncbi:MAG: transcription elongation factor GreA [Deltaproteobacteria bacterium]|nr:transcription elongation factor GreA [Deltaproteobacteria bacterium]